MSDGSLSQDEIDALLLGGGADLGLGGGGGGGSAPGPALSGQEQQFFEDLLGEIIAPQSSNLTNIMGKNVTIQSPLIEVTQKEEFLSGLSDEIVQVRMDFQEGITGGHLYVFAPDAAVKIAGPMIGQEEVILDASSISAVVEACSTINGSATTTMGDRTGTTIMPAAPEGDKIPKVMAAVPQGDFVKVLYPVNIEGQDPIQIIEIFELNFVKEVASRGGISEPEPLEALQPLDAAPTGGGMGMGGQQMGGMGMGMPQGGQQMGGMGMGGQQMGGMGMGGQQMGGMGMGGQQMGGMGMMPQGGQMMGGMNMGMPQGPNVQSVQFANLQSHGNQYEQGNIGLLMDVSMELTVELGRTKKLIKEILGMGEGTIIELDKLAGEPVDILVNHKLIAKGEVVVIDENFGVRVTEIISPMDRVGEMGG